MKRILYLQQISQLFVFKTMEDDGGNEYVLLAQNPIDHIQGITDRTAFEARENHVHLLNRVNGDDISACISIGKSLGRALLNSLQAAYPRKEFVVFVSVRKKDSLIIRFHQKWAGEPPYYDPRDFQSKDEVVLMLE